MTTSRSSVFLLWLLAFANCVAVVVVFVIWVDRPVADRVNAMMRQSPLFDWTARILGSLSVVVAIVALILVWWVVQYLRRRPPAAWAALPLWCSWSVAGARRRPLCGMLFTLVAVAIILTNGHWVSDVIGGGFLGAFSGWLTVGRRSHAGPMIGPPGLTRPGSDSPGP